MVIITYGIYLLLSVIITFWVGHTLHKNGRVFLLENFRGHENLADSINHLLLVGFYLINAGFVTLALRYGDKPEDTIGLIEILSLKIGLVIAVLGIMHFFNMRFLIKFRDHKFFKTLAQNEGPQAT